jgi:hypothetical protein
MTAEQGLVDMSRGSQFFDGRVGRTFNLLGSASSVTVV